MSQYGDAQDGQSAPSHGVALSSGRERAKGRVHLFGSCKKNDRSNNSIEQWSPGNKNKKRARVIGQPNVILQEKQLQRYLQSVSSQADRIVLKHLRSAKKAGK